MLQQKTEPELVSRRQKKSSTLKCGCYTLLFPSIVRWTADTGSLESNHLHIKINCGGRSSIKRLLESVAVVEASGRTPPVCTDVTAQSLSHPRWYRSHLPPCPTQPGTKGTLWERQWAHPDATQPAKGHRRWQGYSTRLRGGRLRGAKRCPGSKPPALAARPPWGLKAASFFLSFWFRSCF